MFVKQNTIQGVARTNALILVRFDICRFLFGLLTYNNFQNVYKLIFAANSRDLFLKKIKIGSRRVIISNVKLTRNRRRRFAFGKRVEIVRTPLVL